MTTITIRRNGDVHDINISGHAGYDIHGADIVCAGVSMLTYTLAQALSRMEADGDLQVMTIDITDGRSYIHANPANDMSAQIKLQTIIVTITDGFRLLADKYPNNVHMVYQGGENSLPEN